MTGSTSFDRLAEVYDETRGGLRRGRAFAKELVGWVIRGVVLEVGVGTAAVAAPLRDLLGLPVLGVDLSPKMAAHATDRLGNVVAVGDAEELPVSSTSIDTIVLVWVMQLVGDPPRLFSEVMRVLRPGGRLVAVEGRALSEPDDEIAKHFMTVMEPLRRVGSDPEVVRGFAREAGLQMVSDGLMSELAWEESPNHAADRIESRSYSVLLDLTEEEFERHARPAINALRRRDAPDRPRRRVNRHPFVVFERPADQL